MALDIGPLNSELPDSAVRPKVQAIRKQCEVVTKLLRYEPPPEHSVQSSVSRVQPRHSPQFRPTKPKADSMEDDLTFFLCTMVSELSQRMVQASLPRM